MTIICEIGQNHCGNMELARQLIRLAKENGADLVKFQLYNHNILYGDKLPNVELSYDQAKMLFDFGAKVGIEVFFSVFDAERVEWCEKIGVKRYKLAFVQRGNQELKMVMWLTHKPVIVSTQSPYEVGDYLLYCVSKYPAGLAELSLGDVDWERFAGFSDHTIGLDAAKIVLARGAKIIEKHFAIDHKTGVDAKWSMTPSELKELKRWERVCRTGL